MNQLLRYRPPRIALVLVAISGLVSYVSPPGTILYFPCHFRGILLAAGGFAVLKRTFGDRYEEYFN